MVTLRMRGGLPGAWVSRHPFFISSAYGTGQKHPGFVIILIFNDSWEGQLWGQVLGMAGRGAT